MDAKKFRVNLESIEFYMPEEEMKKHWVFIFISSCLLLFGISYFLMKRDQLKIYS